MIGQTLSHYRIIGKLGEGGMGEVYEAEDLRLGRHVALKLLGPHLTEDRQAIERLRREARAASSLSHPHICTIYDIDEAASTSSGPAVHFITMELLRGCTLKARLAERRLGVDEILALGLQVAQGLEAAHASGIIHRDIKPANIFITVDGQAKILDFGVAKLAAEAPGVTEAATMLPVARTRLDLLTTPGTSVGTVAYMSPEQALGKPLDTRTDLFSLGVVLYEMATGLPPFGGDTPAALFDGLLHQAPRGIQLLNPTVPDTLARIVDKALEKDRELRYQSARDMSVDLARVTREREAGRVLVPVPADSTHTPSLAVLPFANLSTDKENEYFSDGLAEDIIDALTQVPGLRVMARTSAFAFRGKEQDVREIGARLNVEHILEGSVRRSGTRLRVTAQLVKASDGYHLWSQRFDREMTDVFAIQDEISQAIVEKLRVRLTGDRPLVKRYTENLAAYDLCLKARYHVLKVTQEGLEAAQRHCEQAIGLDPGYTLAYVVLAEASLWGAFFGSGAPRELLPRAKSAALEALRLDDTLAEAHGVLGAVLGAGEFDWPGAERECRRALELNPSSANVRYFYASWYLQPLGRMEEALTEIRRAVELSPLDSLFNAHVGYCLHAAGQFEAAIAQLQHAIDLDPTFWYPVWLLSSAYALRGRHDEAIAAAEKAKELSGGLPPAVGQLGRAYALVGRTAEARQLLDELETRRRSSYVPASAIAMIHRGLGDFEKALELWTTGVDEHDVLLAVSLRAEPGYDPLRSHPAYHALLRKMNLEP